MLGSDKEEVNYLGTSRGTVQSKVSCSTLLRPFGRLYDVDLVALLLQWETQIHAVLCSAGAQSICQIWCYSGESPFPSKHTGWRRKYGQIPEEGNFLASDL